MIVNDSTMNVDFHDRVRCCPWRNPTLPLEQPAGQPASGHQSKAGWSSGPHPCELQRSDHPGAATRDVTAKEYSKFKTGREWMGRVPDVTVSVAVPVPMPVWLTTASLSFSQPTNPMSEDMLNICLVIAAQT